MFNLANMALQMIMQNPNVANSPFGQKAIQAIQTGDNATGEQLANNILQSMGLTKEQAIEQAKNGFGFK